MAQTDSSRYALFALRISLFLFMFAWALLKVSTPGSYGASDTGSGIFGSFYGVSLGQPKVILIGLAQALFLMAFVAGAAKTVTTGGVMVMNLITLLVSLPQIIPAFAGGGNILFVASLPVFAASLVLFLMRRQDTFLCFSSRHAMPG